MQKNNENLDAEISKMISAGPRNDFLAKVDISKANGGYYSNIDPLNAFLTMGIAPSIPCLPKKINYCDFGGGDGILAKTIADFLSQQGFESNTIVLDANPDYLATAAQQYGLFTLQANLETSTLKNCHLITMRGVNHYNSLKAQKLIYKKTFDSLSQGGFFISSICSGSSESCQLKSDIANLPSLGRAYEENQIHATSIDEYIELLQEAGFKNIELKGFAPSQYWHPIELWERSNYYAEQLANSNNDSNALSKIEKRKNSFIKETDKLVKEYLATHSSSNSQDRNIMYKLIPDTEYPILSARKD